MPFQDILATSISRSFYLVSAITHSLWHGKLRFQHENSPVLSANSRTECSLSSSSLMEPQSFRNMRICPSFHASLIISGTYQKQEQDRSIHFNFRFHYLQYEDVRSSSTRTQEKNEQPILPQKVGELNLDDLVGLPIGTTNNQATVISAAPSNAGFATHCHGLLKCTGRTDSLSCLLYSVRLLAEMQ